MPRENAVRNWTFTYNNYPEDLSSFNSALTEISEYAIYGFEVGESGTRHLQGYIQLKKKERLSTLRDKLGALHFEHARAGFEENKNYCSKDGNFVEFGTPSLAGKRRGLADACEHVRKGGSLRELAEVSPEVFVRYGRGLRDLQNTLGRRRDFKTTVYWYYGSTGTGKSRRVHELEPDAYWKPATNRWWDGYDGQEAIVIDDYRRDFCTFAELLRLFDRYPYSVEIKGGTKSFVSRRIYITTPKSPQETWEGRTEEDLAQLLRRIEHVEKFEAVEAEGEPAAEERKESDGWNLFEERGWTPLDELVAMYGSK